MASADSRFLRRWQRWHRLGWPVYLICSLAISAVLTAISVCCFRNLFDYGLIIVAWCGLSRTDYFWVAGGVFASSYNLTFGAFRSNEDRYDRLAQVNRDA